MASPAGGDPGALREIRSTARLLSRRDGPLSRRGGPEGPPTSLHMRQRRAVVVAFDGSGERELTYAAMATRSCIVRFATTGFINFAFGPLRFPFWKSSICRTR